MHSKIGLGIDPPLSLQKIQISPQITQNITNNDKNSAEQIYGHLFFFKGRGVDPFLLGNERKIRLISRKDGYKRVKLGD